MNKENYYKMSRKLIFSVTISEGPVFKKVIGSLKKTLDPLPICISPHGIYINQRTESLYIESVLNGDKFLEFYFDPKLCNTPKHRMGSIIEDHHIIVFSNPTIKGIVASVNKNDLIKFWQYEDEDCVYFNVHREGNPEKFDNTITPLKDKDFPYFTTDEFERYVDDPSCKVICKEMNNFIKSLNKSHIEVCTMDCYNNGFSIKSSLNPRNVKSGFTVGSVDKQPLFSRELSKVILSIIFEMTNITPSGFLSFYMEKGTNVIRIRGYISFLGEMTLYITPEIKPDQHGLDDEEEEDEELVEEEDEESFEYINDDD